MKSRRYQEGVKKYLLTVDCYVDDRDLFLQIEEHMNYWAWLIQRLWGAGGRSGSLGKVWSRQEPEALNQLCSVWKWFYWSRPKYDAWVDKLRVACLHWWSNAEFMEENTPIEYIDLGVTCFAKTPLDSSIPLPNSCGDLFAISAWNLQPFY